jgi:hypothetical protein
MPKRNFLLTKKKMGRPSTGIGHLVGVRLAPNLLDNLDRWIEAQPDPKPSRPEAIRVLLRERLGES